MLQELIKKSIKSVLTKFVSPSLYLKWVDRRNGNFIPGENQISPNWFLTLLSSDRRPVRFVQIGANDGVNNDPIHDFIKKYQWTGILVEPLPDMMERLKKSYAGLRDLIFENVGIAGENGSMDFYFFPPEINQPNWLQQIGTFDKDAILLNLANFPQLHDKIITRKIPTLTLKDLLERNGFKKTDLLIIDAEGFEYKILSQLDKLAEKPSYVLFEWGCMNKADQKALYDFLKRQHYRLYSSGGDVLAALQKN